MLIFLYQGLFKYFEINPKIVLTWKREGILIQEMKEVFEGIPPQNRGQYYPWFLEYQDLLDPSQETSTKVTDDFCLESVTRAWRHNWLSAVAHQHRIERHWHREGGLAPAKRNCFDLCELVLSNFHPCPPLCISLSFGSMAFAQPETRRNATRDWSLYAGYVLKNSTRLIPVLSSNSTVPRI